MRPFELAACLGLGALAGLGVGLIVWRYADSQLKTELSSGGSELAQALAQGRGQVSALAAQGQQQVEHAVQTAIQTQVIPAVRTTVRQQLAASGVTPQLISDVQQAVTLAKRAGVIH